MKKVTATTFLFLALLGMSCKSVIQSVFGTPTPHEKYADQLEDRGLEDTPEGRLWLAASKKALAQPQSVQLPYRQHGYFHPDRPRALGLRFEARRGERLTFQLTRKGGSRAALYADLFAEGGSEPLVSADTSGAPFHFDVEAAGTYLLRLQPELAGSGEYSLSVSTGPSLDFPVSGSKARVGSFWGADRDGGRRRHEGIDIFAPRLTPAVAAADGYITGLREGGLGGKTVWMRLEGRDVHLYYAHLDKQLVKEGQWVKKGDVIGLVGNTGNARTTPPHLHFGVYTSNGPIDPLPFVDKTRKTAPALAARELKAPLKLVRTQKRPDGEPVRANTVLLPLAVTAGGYITELPDGSLLKVPFASVKKLPATTGPSSITRS